MELNLSKLIDRIDITRSRIEAQVQGAAIIHVASARLDDCAHTLAAVLAYSFRRTGQTTLLVESVAAKAGKPGSRGSSDDLFARIRPGIEGEPDRLDVGNIGAWSAADIKALYALLRSRYAITITAHSLAEQGGALGLATHSDVVIVSVKTNRGACAEDRQLNDALRASNAPIMGVVMLDNDAERTLSTLKRDAKPQFVAEDSSKRRLEHVRVRVG